MRQRRRKAYRRVLRHHPNNAFAGTVFCICLFLLIAAF